MDQRSPWRPANKEVIKMTVQPPLHIGVVDFSEPTLLLISEARGFRWLADQIEHRNQFTISQIKGPAQTRVTIQFVPAQAGSLNRTENVFTWGISRAESKLFADQLRELSVSTTPAHTYLDSASRGIPVIASFDEYDPEKIFSN